jgi:hypothetical protein
LGTSGLLRRCPRGKTKAAGNWAVMSVNLPVHTGGDSGLAAGGRSAVAASRATAAASDAATGPTSSSATVSWLGELREPQAATKIGVRY